MDTQNIYNMPHVPEPTQAGFFSARYVSILAAAFVGCFCISIVFVHADTMSSTHYKIQSDSMNFAGVRSTSASYTMEDTLGEVATGVSSSTNYAMNAGYQQMHEVAIAVVPAGNVTLSPAINGLNGGTADGSTSFTVTTDDQAGYTVTLAASSAPALSAGAHSFADYAPAGAVPDFTFSNAAAASSFAFTPEGSDIAVRYQDVAGACGVAGGDTTSACWDGLSTVPRTIVTRASNNQTGGTVTTLRFRAASGASHVQPDGTYVATTTLTITAQ